MFARNIGIEIESTRCQNPECFYSRTRL